MEGDSTLFRRWREGDRDAGSELFTRHFDTLYRFFANKLPEESEDLIQNTWMACLRYPDRVEAAASFRAYLLGIARNELFRVVRRNRKTEIDVNADALVDVAPSPATFAALAEQDRRLLSALRRLPVEAQMIVELYFWEELTAAEMADVLGLALGTAKSRLRAAKARLDRELEHGTTDDDDAFDAWVRSMRDKLEKIRERT